MKLLQFFVRLLKNYPSSQELQSIVDLGFHIFVHHFQWSLAIACLFFIPIIFKTSFMLSLHLLHDHHLFLIPSILA